MTAAQPRVLTLAPPADQTLDLDAPRPDRLPRTCCSRDMVRIEVIEATHHLALHTCLGCGAHRWECDGVELDRDGVLDTVRARLAEAPPRGRWATKRSAAVSAGAAAADRLAARHLVIPRQRDAGST